MDQVFENQQPTSKSHKPRSIKLTVSRRAALALQKVEEERQLLEQRDNEALMRQRKRDEEYLSQKYSIIEDDAMSNSSFGDDELDMRNKSESIRQWTDNVQRDKHSLSDRLGGENQLSIPQLNSRNVDSPLHAEIVTFTTNQSESNERLVQKFGKAASSESQPAVTSTTSSSQSCQRTQDIVGDYIHESTLAQTSANYHLDKSCSWSKKPPISRSTSHQRTSQGNNVIQSTRETFYHGQAFPRHMHLVVSKSFNTSTATVSSVTSVALSTGTYVSSGQRSSTDNQQRAVANLNGSIFSLNEQLVTQATTSTQMALYEPNQLVTSAYHPTSSCYQSAFNYQTCTSTCQPNGPSNQVFWPSYSMPMTTSMPLANVHPVTSQSVSQTQFNPSLITNYHTASQQPFNSTFSYQQQPASINNTFIPNSQPTTAHYSTNMNNGMNQSYGNGSCGTMANISIPSRLTAEQIAARHVMPRDLPYFDGNPNEWEAFISAYENSTETCGFSNNENMGRLQKCLKGDALTAVRSRLFHKDSVPGVIHTLRLMYGRPELIIETMIRDIHKIPAPTNDDLSSLIRFAIAIQNLNATIQHTGAFEHLRNPILINSISDKLPARIQLNWAFYKNSLGNVNLSHVGEWLYQLAIVASQVVQQPCYKRNHKSYPNPQIENQANSQESEYYDELSKESTSDGDSCYFHNSSESQTENQSPSSDEQSLVESEDECKSTNASERSSSKSNDGSLRGSHHESDYEEFSNSESDYEDFNKSETDYEGSDSSECKLPNKDDEVNLDHMGSVNGGKYVAQH